MITHKQAPRPATPEPLRVPSVALSLALFLFLYSVYLLTYTPRINSSDGLAMFATAESLLRRGEWDADQIWWMGLQQGIFGPDGHLYIRKGVGVSLLALPLAGLGLIIPIWGAATTTLLFNAIVTAATGALLLHYLQELGYADGVALIAALTFGLTTLAWPYAKSLFSDPLAGLCLLAAALALLRFRNAHHVVYTFCAGLALAVAVATRYANAALIPLYGLLLIAYQIRMQRDREAKRQEINEGGKRAIGKVASRPANLQSLVGVWLAFAAPLLVTALALAAYNLARYGDPLNTGYLPEESFSGIWWQGVAGLLVSPGRGLFLYAPVLLLALPATPAFWRRHRAEAALAWAVILAHLLLYGKWFMWHGGYAWGPRFMVPTLPFFIGAMAPAIEWAKVRAWPRLGLATLAILSGLIQVLGLSVHFELFQTRLLDTGLPLFAPITFFSPRYSPLIGQFQFLRTENLDLAWIANGRLDWPLLAVLTAAVLVSARGLARMGRIGRSRNSELTASPPDQPRSFRFWVLPALRSSPLPMLVSLGATFWLLAQAHTLYRQDLRNAVALLNAHSTAAELVITGIPEESAAFADLYKGRADVLGLDAGRPLDADTMALLDRRAKLHPRVWWLPNWLPSAESSIERWLMRNGFRVEERSFGGQRLALYYFPTQPLTETVLDAVIGDNIVLERARTLPGLHPGDVLPVVLRWQARQPIRANYYVFVHLLDADGQRILQADGQPALWTRPTSSWQPGEPIEDRYALALPANLSRGTCTLVVGMYQPESGQRLQTEDGKTFISLGTIDIRE